MFSRHVLAETFDVTGGIGGPVPSAVQRMIDARASRIAGPSTVGAKVTAAPGRVLWIAVILFAPMGASAQTYNAVSDFSILNGNPNGNWSYGYSNTYSGVFTLFDLPDSDTQGTGADTWRRSVGHESLSVSLNNTGSTIDGKPWWTGDTLLVHPGQDTEYAIVRWTAPHAGKWYFDGVLRTFNPSCTVDAHVRFQGSDIVSGALDSPGSSIPLSFARDFAQDEFIDFLVGKLNGDNLNDSAGLQLQIQDTSPVPEPSSLLLLSVVPALALNRRRGNGVRVPAEPRTQLPVP